MDFALFIAPAIVVRGKRKENIYTNKPKKCHV